MVELTVARDGSGDHATVQAAIDAATGGEPVTITVRPGRYREVVRVPADKTPMQLIGATGVPGDVVITFDNASRTTRPDSSTLGTSGSATLTVQAVDVTIPDLTFENGYRPYPAPALRDQHAGAPQPEADRVPLADHRL